MTAYEYQALDQHGVSARGTIEADSERHARQLLREQQLIPTKIKTLKQAEVKKHRNKISAADLSLFTRQLATLIAAGIPVEESLRGVIEQTEKEKNRQLFIRLRSKVNEGFSLAQAMAEYPITFPPLYQATVASGEQTGRLDAVLERLADYTEHQQAITQKVQQALIYPSLMILVSFGIIAFLLSFVVPKIIDVFNTSGQTLPIMTTVLISLSNFIKNYGLILFILLTALLYGFKQSLKKPEIKYYWDKITLKIPMISYLVKTIGISRYIHTFSILFSAGVNVLETMQVSANLLGNQIMRNAFDDALIKVREGSPIHQALKETSFLPPMAIHLISSGEKSGQLAEMMQRAAIQLDTEVKRLIDTALTLLEPIIILLMGAVVLFIVLATLLPIFSMEQLVL